MSSTDTCTPLEHIGTAADLIVEVPTPASVDTDDEYVNAYRSAIAAGITVVPYAQQFKRTLQLSILKWLVAEHAISSEEGRKHLQFVFHQSLRLPARPLPLSFDEIVALVTMSSCHTVDLYAVMDTMKIDVLFEAARRIGLTRKPFSREVSRIGTGPIMRSIVIHLTSSGNHKEGARQDFGRMFHRRVTQRVAPIGPRVAAQSNTSSDARLDSYSWADGTPYSQRQ